MKILMTGMTGRQCEKKKNFLFDMFEIFKKYAEIEGHIVDWRKVTLGEDLSGYDMSIVAVGAVNSISTRSHSLQTMYVMNKLPCVVYFDDWQIEAIAAGFKAISMQFDKYINKTISGQHWFILSPEELKPYENEIVSAARNFHSGEHKNHKLVFPLFNWGNIDKVTPLLNINKGVSVHRFDPSPELMLQGYAFEKDINFDNKINSWFLPTLLDHSSWIKKQKLGWPVEWIGHRKKTGIKVDEREVFNLAERHRGYLSPVYPHDGSGWYRTRFVYSAYNKCILLTGPEDMHLLGESFEISSYVEGSPESVKRDIAESQKKAIISQIYDTEFLKEQLCSIISL